MCSIITVFPIRIAGEGAAFDYTVNTTQAILRSDVPDERASVVFIFHEDTVAPEANETLSLRLVPDSPLPMLGIPFIFRDTINMVIIDSDSKIIAFGVIINLIYEQINLLCEYIHIIILCVIQLYQLLLDLKRQSTS